MPQWQEQTCPNDSLLNYFDSLVGQSAQTHDTDEIFGESSDSSSDKGRETCDE